jgi:DNA-directed RNA polymerase specialized sigma subunit
MNAKEFLRQIKKLDKLIENKLAEVQRWKEIATNVSPASMTMDRVQSSSNPQKIADAICRYIDLEREINQDIDKLVDTKKDVISVIEQLNATEYDVLHKIYVQGFTFDEVAIACHRSPSWATTVHGRALKHVQTILDQRTA